MFQSLTCTKVLGYNKKTKLNSFEYDLTDSEFGCVAVRGADADEVVGAVIQEYTKRNLNVAANLLLYFRWYEKETGHSIAGQIDLAEKYQPLFTPQIKAELDKYLSLL